MSLTVMSTFPPIMEVRGRHLLSHQMLDHLSLLQLPLSCSLCQSCLISLLCMYLPLSNPCMRISQSSRTGGLTISEGATVAVDVDVDVVSATTVREATRSAVTIQGMAMRNTTQMAWDPPSMAMWLDRICIQMCITQCVEPIIHITLVSQLHKLFKVYHLCTSLNSTPIMYSIRLQTRAT